MARWRGGPGRGKGMGWAPIEPVRTWVHYDGPSKARPPQLGDTVRTGYGIAYPACSVTLTCGVGPGMTSFAFGARGPLPYLRRLPCPLRKAVTLLRLPRARTFTPPATCFHRAGPHAAARVADPGAAGGNGAPLRA
ncbi:hypothetical protein Sm713_64420 [Streptomyces sp. TS71-3]|nr:hypothetical protein Sm713_64420 [Streptomyces sp. TS71-3]